MYGPMSFVCIVSENRYAVLSLYGLICAETFFSSLLYTFCLFWCMCACVFGLTNLRGNCNPLLLLFWQFIAFAFFALFFI